MGRADGDDLADVRTGYFDGVAVLVYEVALAGSCVECGGLLLQGLDGGENRVPEDR
jgi:hypothetical protein